MRSSEPLVERQPARSLSYTGLTTQTPVVLITRVPALWTSLADQLRHAGVEVQVVPTADDGLEHFQLHHPALVLADDQLDDDEVRQIYLGLRNQQALLLLFPSAWGDRSLISEPKLRWLVESATSLVGITEEGRPREDQLVFRSLTMDRARMSVTVGELAVSFTPTEFRILWALVEQPGYVLSREQLLIACRDSSTSGRGRTIDAHIRTMRRKLHPYDDLIETVRGIGYRLREFEWPEEASSPSQPEA